MENVKYIPGDLVIYQGQICKVEGSVLHSKSVLYKVKDKFVSRFYELSKNVAIRKETFAFSEALRRMKKGKIVKRANHVREFSIRDGNIVSRSAEYDNVFREVPIVTNDFILATDWEEVEE